MKTIETSGTNGAPSRPATETQLRVIQAILDERDRQDQLVVEQTLPFNLSDPMLITEGGLGLKLSVLGEEFGEVSKEVYELTAFVSEAEDPTLKLRIELIQLAACCVAWLESLCEP